MPKTFITLLGEVLHQAKLPEADISIVVIAKEYINQVLYDLARETRIPQLRKRAIHTFVSTISEFQTSNDFLSIESAYYEVNTPTPLAFVWLMGVHQQTPYPIPLVFGKPNRYQLELEPGGFSRLKLYPETAVVAGDSVTYTFYSAPPPLVADGDMVDNIMWESEIVKRAVANLNIYYNKTEQAKMIIAQTMQSKSEQRSNDAKRDN